MSDAPVRVALVGMGRMGRALAALAPERGFDVVARLGAGEMRQGFSAAALNGAEVAIEFTVPGAAPDNVARLVDAGCAVVAGTTGWDAALPEVAGHVTRAGGALLHAPNFSVGVNLFAHVVEEAARRFAGAPGFDAHLIETHHTAKKDAPSGTALLLARAAAPLGREVPVTSIRLGSVPGTHELLFDAPFETVRLAHVARDRRVFADGALVAARWLRGRRGVFTMRDVLALDPAQEGSA